MYGYLNDKLEEHINNSSIHGGKGTIINNYYSTTIVSGKAEDSSSISLNLGILEKDTVIYLSINDSVSEINEKIKSVPHNLNGYNLAFIFVVPQGYMNCFTDEEIRKKIDIENCEISLDLGNQNIMFSNFFNGTLFIFGDFLQNTEIIDSKEETTEINFSRFTLKKQAAILDPVKYDLINPENYIKKLYKEIDNPESIIDIIDYENKDNLDNVINLKTLNKIKIKGTCINNYYSLMTISDVTAKTYIKNLSFESTLIGKNNVINITEQFISDLPTKDRIFLEYPLESNGVPIIGDSFRNYLQDISNKTYFDKLSGYNEKIDEDLRYLYDIMNSEKLVIKGSDYLTFKIDDQYITILKSQLDQLKELYPSADYDSNLLTQINIDNPYENYTISSSILSAINDFEVPFNDQNLNKNDLLLLYNSFINAYNRISLIKESRPSTDYKTYKTGTGFNIEDFLIDLKLYLKNIEDFSSDLSASFYSSTFSLFLMYRFDLINNNVIPTIVPSNEEAFEQFLKNYEINTYFNSLKNQLLLIEENIIKKMTDIQIDNLSSYFSFNPVGTNINYSHVEPLLTTSDKFLKSNYSDGSVDALNLNYESYDIGYLTTKSNTSIPFLGKLLFKPQFWDKEIKQKFSSSYLNQSKLFDSQYDTTIIFWTKYRETTDINNIAFLSFMVNNEELKFSIRPYAFSSPSNKLNDELDTGDLISNINDNYYSNRNAWVMWSIKIDNSSKEVFKDKSELFNIYQHKIGLQVSTFTFKEDIKKQVGYTIFKEDKNFNGIDLSMLSSNYITEPFSNNSNINDDVQFENFSIKIGYSKEQIANNENVYYYNGYIRNLIIFKGHLSPKEEEAVFKLGILNNYDWPIKYDADELKKLIESRNFFLGLVSIYDSNNINILNCNSKYDGNTYI